MSSKKNNGKKSDIEQKGGRGLSQNHTFLLPKKNDICVRKEGVKSTCHGFFSCEATLDNPQNVTNSGTRERTHIT